MTGRRAGVVALARIAVAASAPVVPALLRHHGLDQLGLAYVAAVLIATALSSVGGFAAALLSAGLFWRGEDVRDTLLLLSVMTAIPVLAALLRREHRRSRSSEHRYRMLVEKLPAGLYIDRPDSSATNVYSNPEIARMLGHPVERWVGDPDFFPSLLHPDDRAGVLSRLEALTGGDGPFEDTYRLRAADGAYRWIVDRGVLVHDERGRPLHVQGVLLDVTDAKEAERQAESVTRRYRSLIERLPLVTYVEDARELGRTLFISPQVVELLGYPIERWLNNHNFFFEVLDPAFHDIVHADRAARKTETAHEFKLIAADGSVRWIHSRRTLVTDAKGEPLYVQGFWIDRTEQRELEAQLRRQDRLEAVGQFAAGVAHNFNNMLTAIAGFAELAGVRDSVDEARSDLAAIRESADKSADLVRSLLAFSRRQTASAAPSDVGLVLSQLIELLRPLVGAHIDLVFEAPAADVTASIDRAQFEQVIVNLAINARDAMPDGGKLTIAVDDRLDGEIGVTISDTGVGIPSRSHARIFDPFFTTKPQGTGLGLSTVYSALAHAGGSIRVAHSAPGEGTTFEVVLPRATVAV